MKMGRKKSKKKEGIQEESIVRKRQKMARKFSE